MAKHKKTTKPDSETLQVARHPLFSAIAIQLPVTIAALFYLVGAPFPWITAVLGVAIAMTIMAVIAED